MGARSIRTKSCNICGGTLISASYGSVICDSCGTIHKSGRKILKKQVTLTKYKHKFHNAFAKKDPAFKKKFLLFSLAACLLIVLIILVSTHTICINHRWLEATCLEPQTCYYCGKTEGNPKELIEFEWPSNGLASLLPAPKSTLGEPRQDSSDYFCICIGKSSINDFNTYVKEC